MYPYHSKKDESCQLFLSIKDTPRYEYKSGVLILRYANSGKDCGSAKHGTIRVIMILAKEEMDVVDKWFDGTYTKNYK